MRLLFILIICCSAAASAQNCSTVEWNVNTTTLYYPLGACQGSPTDQPKAEILTFADHLVWCTTTVGYPQTYGTSSFILDGYGECKDYANNYTVKCFPVYRSIVFLASTPFERNYADFWVTNGILLPSGACDPEGGAIFDQDFSCQGSSCSQSPCPGFFTYEEYDAAVQECLSRPRTDTTWWVWENCDCRETSSPIIIDIQGNGFELTAACDGVLFDLNADGLIEKTAWTAALSDDGFLVLDRNGDGRITSGGELFGNNTPQPQTPQPNGFVALAEFDRFDNGGDSDGQITAMDSIYSRLQIWIDRNHDGLSQSTELKSLPEVGVYSIDLNYKESQRRDPSGNNFRYRAKINGSTMNQSGRWAYDVLLTRIR